MGLTVGTIRRAMEAGWPDEDIQALIDGWTKCLACEERREKDRLRKRDVRGNSADLPHTPSKDINNNIYISEGKRGAGEKPVRGHRLPEDFEVTERMWEWAQEKRYDLNWVADETTKFVDHWRQCSTPNSRKCDWIAAWRNWVRTANERREKNYSNGSSIQRYGAAR